MWLLVVSATFGALLGEFSAIAMGGLFGSIVITLVVSQCLKLRGQASQTPSFLPSKMELPKGSITLIQLILGLSVGSIASFQTIADNVSVPVVTGLILCLCCQISLGFIWLNRAEKWSVSDSIMGAIPGALSALLSMSGRYQSPSAKVVFAHSVRLVLLVLLAAFISTQYAADLTTFDNNLNIFRAIDFFWLCIVATLSIGCGWALDKIALPAPYLTGSLITTITFHSLFNHIAIVVPSILIDVSTTILGAVIGLKLSAVKMSEAWRYARAGILVTTISLSVTIAASYITSIALDMNWAVLLIAWVPGNVEAMTTIALAFSLQPSFVMINHVIRLFILNLTPIVLGQISPSDSPNTM